MGSETRKKKQWKRGGSSSLLAAEDGIVANMADAANSDSEHVGDNRPRKGEKTAKDTDKKKKKKDKDKKDKKIKDKKKKKKKEHRDSDDKLQHDPSQEEIMDDSHDESGTATNFASDGSSDEPVQKKAKRSSATKGRATNVAGKTDEDDSSTPDDKDKAQKTPSRSRYILFVGNLSKTSTGKEIAKHFKKCGDCSVRLLTDKGTGKSRGCAFVEFKTAEAQWRAIKYHKTELGGNAINVEFTAGGGGKSETRKEKLRVLRLKKYKVIRKATDELNEKRERENNRFNRSYGRSGGGRNWSSGRDNDGGYNHGYHRSSGSYGRNDSYY